jgi:hypothetical protein
MECFGRNFFLRVVTKDFVILVLFPCRQSGWKHTIEKHTKLQRHAANIMKQLMEHVFRFGGEVC